MRQRRRELRRLSHVPRRLQVRPLPHAAGRRKVLSKQRYGFAVLKAGN